MNADRSYRIILADDHALFLSGLQGLLSRRAECEVVGTAANEAGAKGFILKSADIDEVVTAIRTVCDGGTYFSQELLRNLVGSLKSTRGERPGDVLSDREKEILLLICRGMSNQEIADKLFISKRTVDKHRANILEKTGCRNTANLVVWAIKNGIAEI